MNHHPDKILLEKYSAAELGGPLTSMISLHLEQCEECKVHYQQIFKSSANTLAEEKLSFDGLDLDLAFQKLTQKIHETNKTEFVSQTNDIKITFNDKVFSLPNSLKFLNEQVIPWKEFGKQNAIAPVLSTKDGNFYLIYMGPGETVPTHSHTHVEYSYVLSGEYHDGQSTYSTGDFSINKTVHTPMATSDDGCLVLSWVEGRLNFFQGIFKPLNSILWWYLHRA
jgi:putative transcriptional regulator